MELETFLAHFESLIDTPKGVQKLRQLILQLAVMGRLVPQDPSDEPASVLLEKIKAEKERLVKEGKIKKEKPLGAIKPEEIPYELPIGWEWVRLGDFGDWGSGSTPNRLEKEYYGGSLVWIKSGELNDGVIKDSEEKITDKAFKECSLRLNKVGDVLIAMYGATIGKISVLDVKATTNQAVCACTCFQGVYNLYLFFLLKAYKNTFVRQGVGGAQPNISRQKIIHTIVPLPPLAEQNRIVVKCDRLLSLCDELEAQKTKRQTNLILLGQTATSKLIKAKNHEQFSTNWRMIADNFEAIYSTAENVSQLRKAILQLAVMGRLVPQEASDEPASVLLEKIKAEKERLVKEGKIKKEKPLGAIKPEEIPYELPSGWEWARLGEIIELISGQHLTPELQNQEKQGIAYFTGASDLGDFSPYVTRWTTEAKAIAFEKDILLSVKGTIGKSNIMNLAKAGIGRQLMALRAILIDYKYIYLICLRSCDLFVSLAVGIAIPGISREDILNLVVSLPPLAEQNRIVAKCDRLLSVCDTLEQQLTQRSKNKEALIEVIINKILKKTI